CENDDRMLCKTAGHGCIWHLADIPTSVGLPGCQQPVVAEKGLNGRVITREIMPVLFSVVEGFGAPRGCAYWTTVSANNQCRTFAVRRPFRWDLCGKPLISLALPRGLEPLFSP